MCSSDLRSAPRVQMFSSLKPFESRNAVYARTSVSARERGSRKPIKLQLHPPRYAAATELSSRDLGNVCYFVPVARTANRLCKSKPGAARRCKPGVNLRRVSATNTKLIALQSCNKLFLCSRFSLFTRALNLPSSCTRYTLYLRIEVCTTLQIDQLGKTLLVSSFARCQHRDALVP